MESSNKNKTIIWIIAGCLALCVLLACAAAAIAGGVALISQSRVTPTPPVNRGEYTVIIRYLTDVDASRISQLEHRLKSLGYNVEMDSETSTQGWSFPQSAFLYGHPSCVDAIADIRYQTRDLADLSLPMFRFTQDDTAYNRRNIVIQILENEILRP